VYYVSCVYVSESYSNAHQLSFPFIENVCGILYGSPCYQSAVFVLLPVICSLYCTLNDLALVTFSLQHKHVNFCTPMVLCGECFVHCLFILIIHMWNFCSIHLVVCGFSECPISIFLISYVCPLP
jgi:hypothetical protein